jgi:hypothetical protein
MWRHKWFKILIGLQLVNFAAMALLEQQRRTIWNKETAATQKLTDAKFFTEKTEQDLRYLFSQMKDLQDRLVHLEVLADRNANNNSLAIDTRLRVMRIEEALKITPPEKQP